MNRLNDAPETLAIVGATILDGNGGTPIRDGVVVIEGSRILAVGDRSTPIPPEATEIVASGKFVIPGLMSAYTCLVDGAFLTTVVPYEGRFDELAIEAAQLALKGGVTTVFDPWGPRDALVKAREAIKQGRAVGSRIYLAGNIVGYDGPFSEDFRPKHREVVPRPFATRIDAQWQLNVGRALVQMSPEQVREEIRKYIHSGVDFVSCAITDHCCTGGALKYLVFSSRVLQLIVEEAHRAGLPVVGWAPWSNEGVVHALNAGIDHTIIGRLLPYISEETVAMVGRRQLPCAYAGYTAQVHEWFRGRPGGEFLEGQQAADDMIRRLYDAGAVPMLMTSGQLFSRDEVATWPEPMQSIKGFGVLGQGHVFLLQAMQENGLSPMGALMAATRNISRAYKVDKDLGTLERGKLADLLILDEDPLKDTKNYFGISVVMKEGKVIDRGALPTQRLIIAPPPHSQAYADSKPQLPK
jgi:imidazolonepropionase-like amidohydrolase